MTAPSLIDNTTLLSSLYAAISGASHCFQEQADIGLYKDGSYPYVPSPPEMFMERLISVINHAQTRELKFVDLGCGAGLLLKMASYILRLPVTGIDIDPAMIALAKRINFNATIIQNDLMKENYSEYDVLYFFRPFQDMTKQILFEEKLIEEMKSGAYIIAIYSQNQFYMSKKFEKVPHILKDTFIKI